MSLHPQHAILSSEYSCHICVSRGVCGSCGSALESIQLTSEEYRQLKDRVMADVIQGQDVFKKTTPEVRTHTHTQCHDLTQEVTVKRETAPCYTLFGLIKY